MSAPKTSAAYPVAMLQALDRAAQLGELVVPCANPKAMRLQFQGLRGALRAEGKSEQADSVGFYLQDSPKALVLRSRDTTPMAQEISKALSLPPQESAIAAADSALDRILSGVGVSENAR